MERRDVLGIIGGMAAGIHTPELPEKGRLGWSDINRLREPLAAIASSDDRRGGVALAAVAARHARRIGEAIECHVLSSRVERAAYALIGEYLAAAGWYSVDADDLDGARRYLDQALRMSTLAADPILQAQIWSCLAIRARQANEYPEAQAIAKTGLNSTAARRNPKIAALFHARAAHGHAFRNEYGPACRSIGRAFDSLGKADCDTPTPPWLAFLDQAQLHAMAAIAHNVLGRYDLAEAHATHDLDLIRGTYRRNRVHGMLHLAQARLGRREIDQSVTDATAALRMAGEIRGGVRTGRLANRLRGLRQQYHVVAGKPAVQDWIAAYDAAVASDGAPPAVRGR